MSPVVFPLSQEELISFVPALHVPSSLSHQVYHIILWPLSFFPSYLHDTVFRSVWNHGLVPWVPSLPQHCWFIEVMLFIFALDTSLDTSECNVGKIRYISQFLCVFIFISSIVVVQFLSCVPLFETPWTAARKVSLFFTIPGVCSDSCPLSRWCHPPI